MIKRLLIGLLLSWGASLATGASLTTTATLGVAGGPGIPNFSVACGSYSSTQSVTLSSSTTNAAIHYTTDGSAPSLSSPLYSSAISVAANTLLRGVATAPILGQSAVSTCSYTISATGMIKWHPGHYMDSQLFSSVGNPNSSGKAAEIAVMHAGPSVVKGYESYYFWSIFEPTSLGVYNFAQLDTDYNEVTGYVSGTGCTSGVTRTDPRRIAIYMLQTNYFSNDPTGFMPTYITSNPGTYGMGADGVHGGYWTATGTTFGGGSTAAIYRSSVMARFEALFAAMGAHTFADGCTVDGSPYVEWVKTFLETASVQPQNPGGASGAAADSTFSQSGLQTQIAALNSSLDTSFPHTTFVTPANYTGPTGNEDVTLANSLPASRSGSGGPDVFGLTSGTNVAGGLSGLTYGQLAYNGLLPPGGGPTSGAWLTGGTNEQGIVPYVGTVQCTEIVAVCGIYYTPTDIFNQGNTTLKATHMAWSYITAGQYSGQTTAATWLGTASSMTQWLTAPGTWGGLLDMLYNNALSTTACPSAYTTGCNTTLNLPAANDDHFLKGRLNEAA